MDDLRFGSIVRAARVRRGWRQLDLADAAGVSRGSVSRIERGALDDIAVSMIRRVATALEIRVELLPRSRHAELDRLVSARHAALAEHVGGWLRRIPGWTFRPEVSFSFYGDRGVVDIVAWNERVQALLLVELKTEIVDVGEVLGTLDRRHRLGAQIGAQLSWRPAVIGSALLIGDSRVNRNRVRAHAATFRAGLPDDGRRLRGWLREPVSELRALTFVSNARHGGVRSAFSAPRRVRARYAAPARPKSSMDAASRPSNTEL
jgi:transcriptional regulator with XRE-family HTH domain